ncbi:MAG: hypothetical protein ACJ74W_15100 [Pyrinomonadaceae bacterium]
MFSPMNPGDYRREYAAYSAALARAHYEYHTGRTTELRLSPLRDRYDDLWTRAAVADLERAHRDTPTQFETERTARQRLLAVARLGYAELSAREVTDELRRCERAAHVEWMGTRRPAADAPELIACEPDATNRRELSARWLDAGAACADLRAARLVALRAANVALDLARDEADKANEATLTAQAATLLARTETVYDARLHEWAALHLPPQYARAPVFADGLFFARLAWLDQFFPLAEWPAGYNAALAGLGIRVAQQLNLRVEWPTQSTRPIAATYFGLEPPADVRLVAGTRSGAQLFSRFFQAAGCAQQLAWVSHDLAARYPEFVHAPDATTRVGYGFLFRYLLHDEAWLGEYCGLKPSAARAVARDLALVELHDARRCCAQGQYQTALAGAPDVRAERLAAEYAAAHTEATGFRHEPALYLQDASEHADAATANLRARLFAAALGEYLRARHGRRWWTTRAAGDELIDLWNTGARYTVEELAALVGAGALDVELLAEHLLTAVAET